MKFRAIHWRVSSDAAEPIGPWRRSWGRATSDAIEAYRPHARAVLEIEDQRGRRREITRAQYEAGEAAYDAAISARDDRGVWG